MILTAEEKSKVAEDAKESLRVHCVLPQRHRGKKTSPPNSGVSAYEIEDDFIIVQFSDDTIHLYNNKSISVDKARAMKRLAASGD